MSSPSYESKQDLKTIYEQFKAIPGNPLKGKKELQSFIGNDDKKIQFLSNLRTFNKDFPNFNYADFLQFLNKNNKYKLDAIIDFSLKPTITEPLKMLGKDLSDDILLPQLAKFEPTKFEIFIENQPTLTYDKKLAEDKIQSIKTEASKGMGAGAITESDIKEVLTPRMRGSVQAKQAKQSKDEREDIITKFEKAEEIERQQMEKEEKLKQVKTDSMGNVIESEDAPRVLSEEELQEQEKEADEEKEEERPPATAIPATISPDERDEAVRLSLDDMIKKMEEQMEAEEDAKKKEILRQEIEKAKAEAQEKRKTDIATMTLGKGSSTGKVEEIKIQDVPQDIRAIPKERGSTTGKTEAQLKDDINYFFKTYPDMLKKQKGQFMTILRGKSPALRKKQLIELHRRIVGLVGSVEDKDIGKKIGIVLNADKYLDDKINAILLSKITQGMTAGSLVVNVTDKTKDDKSKRIGSYQITKGRSGLLNAQKAPVYRSIPSTNDSQDRRSNRPIKLKTLPTQRWDEVNTAKKQMRLDPFEPKREKVNRFDIYL